MDIDLYSESLIDRPHNQIRRVSGISSLVISKFCSVMTYWDDRGQRCDAVMPNAQKEWSECGLWTETVHVNGGML